MTKLKDYQKRILDALERNEALPLSEWQKKRQAMREANNRLRREHALDRGLSLFEYAPGASRMVKRYVRDGRKFDVYTDAGQLASK
jgi:hypothetical protein